MTIDKYLEDLESRIDPSVEDALYAEWKNFADGGFDGVIFAPRRARPAPPRVEWPTVSINAAFDDYDKMLLHQYRAASGHLAAGSGYIMDVRANYGTSILPSLFGVELFMMDEELDTLPTSWPIAGGAGTIERLVKRGVPDINAGLVERTLEAGRRFREASERYPKIGKYVHIYHPDLQGPMDVCEVIWGSGIFLELVDKPELVKAFLDIITETYIRVMKCWDGIVGPSVADDGYAAHWDMLHKGHIMLRDDSAMNLSPAMFEEFVRPYDQRLLDGLGGGGIHFCGRGDHYIESLSGMRGVYNVPMSQPEYNDMERIYRNTVDKGIQLLSFHRWAADEALARGRDLKGNVHCR